MAKAASRRQGNDEQTGAERITLAISLALLAILVGGIVWIELQRGDARARITVTPHFDAAYQHDGDWYLPTTIRNDGDRPTDVLHVSLERPIEGEQPEVAELVYAFVSGGEEVDGTAVFDEEPTADTIEVDVVAVTDP